MASVCTGTNRDTRYGAGCSDEDNLFPISCHPHRKVSPRANLDEVMQATGVCRDDRRPERVDGANPTVGLIGCLLRLDSAIDIGPGDETRPYDSD